MKYFLIFTALLVFGSFHNLLIAQDQPIKPESLTAETFKQKVFNYEKNKETWVFNGKIPCIIDFYADWCKPCKMVAPIMEELANDYKGKVNVYKVNTDQQKELASLFNIRSIPSVMFCPMEGKPQMTTGAYSKDQYKKYIDQFIFNITETKNQ